MSARGRVLGAALGIASVLAISLPAGASAASGVISGQITDETNGQGIDQCVELHDAAGNSISSIPADSQGHYSFSGLATGTYYLYFHPCFGANYVAEWYSNAVTFNDADPISVTDGQTTTINAAMAHGGTITGTVKNDDGDPLSGIVVSAQIQNGSTGGSASTDSNGSYSIAGLPAGSYSVGFFDSGTTYVAQYWNDKPDYSSATPVPVTVDTTTPNISPTLHPGGSISGTVTDAATGNPLEGICVGVYGQGTNSVCATTDANGHYSLSKIPPGSVKVRFAHSQDQEHRDQYYNDRPDLTSGDSVTVVAEQNTPNIDAALGSSTAPLTHPTSGPQGTVNSPTATIGFAADQSPVTYECDLDGLGFQSCAPPVTYTCLSSGTHTMRVRATNQAGEVENPPSQGSWTVSPTATCNTTSNPSVPPNGNFTTDPGGGPTPGDPVTTSVTTPSGGNVSVTDNPYPGPAPSGYTILGHELQITAPNETPGSPLRLVFTLDASTIPAGVDPSTITVFRNGVAAGQCPGSTTAVPDPCIADRQTLTGGDLQFTVLSSHASTWDLAAVVPEVSVPTLGPASSAPPAPTVAPVKKCKKVKKRSASAAKKCKKKKK
jgi:hypothetical protein